jgi:hypothetical protein
MIETSLVAWLLLIFAIFICSVATVRLSSCLPWSEDAKKSPVVFFFGLSLAPFLFGSLGVLALSLLSGASHKTHLIFILAVACICAALAYLFLPGREKNNGKKPKIVFSLDEKIALFLLIAYAFGLIINVLFSPLTQNDSLEYATAARILYETRDLTDYPALDAQRYSSGFYGPWTHPPLYVALIYNAYLLQGHADMPGLMRTISPWFALLAVGMVYAVGSLINRRTGLFSALLFFSTPVFFLGADSALIDALPILGLILVITSIIGIKAAPVKAGLLQGMVLGIALWTHSQALLFFPISLISILLFNGIRSWRVALKQACAFIVAGISIAAVPYVRNLLLFGSLVSDTNIIYALPEMRWADYFSIGRGLDSPASVIQYGVFKGWFAPEYYSMIFWLMTMGVIYFFAKYLPSPALKQALLGMAKNGSTPILLLALGVVFTYLGGVVLSVIMGIDLMIRNERYILVILPFIALISGWFIATLLQLGCKNQFLNSLRQAFIIIVVLGVSVQFTCFIAYRMRVTLSEGGLAAIFERQDKKLLKKPEMLAMDFLRSHVDENALVLSLKPADMYYSGRKMVSYLDPRLIGFYKSESPENSFGILKAIGIDYVYLPDYSLPPFYNSILQDILANPAFASLQFAVGGVQIYKLEDSGLRKKAGLDISPNKIPWVKLRQVIIGGEKGGIKKTSMAGAFEGQEILQLPLGLFQKNFSTILMTGGRSGSKQENIKVNGGSEYLIEFTIKGRGLLDFFVLQLGASGSSLNDNGDKLSGRIPLGNLVLGGNSDKNKFMRRIKLLPDTSFLRFGIEQHGNSEIIIEKVQLSELTRKDNK